MQFIHFLRLSHPARWLKNLIIFLPWIFFDPHNFPLLNDFVIATLLFTLLSSAGYCFNDIIDHKEDRNNHIRSKNPLSTGAVSLPSAYIFAITLSLSALTISFFLNFELFFVYCFYIYISMKYSLVYRRRAYIDILIVSLIQAIRIVVGLVLLKCFIDVPAYMCLILTAYFCGACVVSMKRIYEMKGGAIISPRMAYKEKDSSVMSYVAIAHYSLCIISAAGFIYFHESLDSCIFAILVILFLTMLMFVKKYTNDSFFRSFVKRYVI